MLARKLRFLLALRSRLCRVSSLCWIEEALLLLALQIQRLVFHDSRLQAPPTVSWRVADRIFIYSQRPV